jgi:hypothetical protein
MASSFVRAQPLSRRQRRQPGGLMSPTWSSCWSISTAQSWPITGSSFILMKTHADHPERTRNVLAFFDWSFRHGRPATIALGDVAMPASAVDLIRKLWAGRFNRVGGSPDTRGRHATPVKTRQRMPGHAVADGSAILSLAFLHQHVPVATHHDNI